MSFVAGPYLVAYNSKVVGQTSEGFRFTRTLFKQIITGDWMGQTPQDAINMGMEAFTDFTLLEADAPAVVDIIRPYNGSAGGSDLYAGQVGTLDVKHNICKPLIFSSLLTASVINSNGGSGASNVLPLTRTLPRSIIAENFPITELFGSGLREIPIRMRHYPSPHNQATGEGGGVFGTET